MIAAERVKLENADLRRRVGKPDPRIQKLEEEVRRLRDLVEAARIERDELRAVIEAAVEQLRRG